jgi:hypothetical protein
MIFKCGLDDTEMWVLLLQFCLNFAFYTSDSISLPLTGNKNGLLLPNTTTDQGKPKGILAVVIGRS